MKTLDFLKAYLVSLMTNDKGALSMRGIEISAIIGIVFFVIAFGTIVLDSTTTSSGTGIARLGFQLNATAGALLGGSSGLGNALNILLVLAVVFGVIVAVLAVFGLHTYRRR